MSKYVWRKNFTSILQLESHEIKGRLAFKTKDTNWLETTKPVIILVSTHSAFHKEYEGELKMNAFISTIRNHVKGKVTILFSDGAHLKTMSLKYQNNVNKTFEYCLQATQNLVFRYQSYFQNCHIAYWHSFISEDENFSIYLNFLKQFYQYDLRFRELLHIDAENTYTIERMKDYSDKKIFIEKSIEDLLEQCASLLVLAYKGYRFQFYPGSSHQSVEYVNQLFVPENKKVNWVDVFLSIEKKTIVTWSVENVC